MTGMTTDEACNLISFMIWGDRLILDAAVALPQEKYFQEQGISAGSVHKLLAHCMGAQWIWLERWLGRSPAARPDEQYPTLDSIRQRWPRLHDELIGFVSGQTPQSLVREIAYTDLRGQGASMPLDQQIFHVVDHATYHRGQLNSMVRRAGGTPANTMYWNFVQAGRPRG